MHDRGAIASWLQRESGGHFDGAELRADGSSFVSFISPIGPISVHDYWSFARTDFQSGNRGQSYAEILSRQVPILTLGYTRPSGQPPARAELVAFLNGEAVVGQGYAEAFGPFTQGKPAGTLIAIESSAAGMKAVELYSDAFLVEVIAAIRQKALKPPAP